MKSEEREKGLSVVCHEEWYAVLRPGGHTQGRARGQKSVSRATGRVKRVDWDGPRNFWPMEIRHVAPLVARH